MIDDEDDEWKKLAKILEEFCGDSKGWDITEVSGSWTQEDFDDFVYHFMSDNDDLYNSVIINEESDILLNTDLSMAQEMLKKIGVNVH